MAAGGGANNNSDRPYERMGYEHSFSSPPPLKTKHHHHRRCFTSFFRSSSGNAGDVDSPARSLLRSLRSKVYELPENLCMCSGPASNGGWGRHRRRHSADFKYDPLSYARNFDEGASLYESFDESDQLRHRCFSSRLPPSPPRANCGGEFDNPKRIHVIEEGEVAPVRFS